MDSFVFDANYRDTGLRDGNPISAFYKIPSSISLDTWHRVMPSGAAGAVVADTVEDYNAKLNIGTLRADIAKIDISGWHIDVLNEGYRNRYVIGNYDDNIVHVGSITTYENNQLALHNIAGNVKFVLFPVAISKFYLSYYKNATDNIEIGWTSKPDINPADDDVTMIGILTPGAVLEYASNEIGTLVFKLTSFGTGATNYLSWGEHLIA